MTYIISININFLMILLFLFIWTLVCLRAALGHFLILLLFLDLLLIWVICVFIWQVAISSYISIDIEAMHHLYFSLWEPNDYLRTQINFQGYSFALLILGVAAADTAVGLGLFIVYYKATGEVSIKDNISI